MKIHCAYDNIIEIESIQKHCIYRQQKTNNSNEIFLLPQLYKEQHYEL